MAPSPGQRSISQSLGPNRSPMTRTAHSRLAAGCSTPTASHWPAPGSMCALCRRHWNEIDPMAARQKGRVAATDADGRFHFELDKGSSHVSYDSGQAGWHKAQVAVAAPGFAPAWVEAGDMVKQGDMALRLVRDDVPVRGRVLDAQGRPVAGVTVRIRAIWEVKDGIDLDALLASGVRYEDLYQIAILWGAARLGGPELATGPRVTLARRPERLDHRRRRTIRGPGDRPRPHRPAGVPRRRRGRRHARRDGPRREGAAQCPAAARHALRDSLGGRQGAFLGSTPRGRRSSDRPSNTSPARPSRSRASSA